MEGSNEGQISLIPTAKPTDDRIEPTKKVGEPDNQKEGSQEIQKNEVTNEIEPTEKNEPTEQNNSSKENKVTDESEDIASLNPDTPRIEDFSEVDTQYEDYEFDVSYDEKLELYERTYLVQGEYDLNGDGKADCIEAVLKADYEEGSYIEVNGRNVTMNPFNSSGEIKIIDLDSDDDYSEIAIFDEGPSGDPTYLFYQYDGSDLYLLGSIDRSALMDGQGRFISGFHLTNYLKPQFFSAWGEFKENEFAITNHDVEQYIGETYEVDGVGFFEPLDTNPENYFEYTRWDFESQREFKATTVKLLDIHISPEDRTLNWFYVELPDGERGLLYFWIGD